MTKQEMRVLEEDGGHFVLVGPSGRTEACGRFDAAGRFCLCDGAAPFFVGEVLVHLSDIETLIGGAP